MPEKDLNAHQYEPNKNFRAMILCPVNINMLRVPPYKY